MIDARLLRRILSDRRILIGLGFLVAYVALDYVSYVKPYRGLGITPWNPPPGLSIAIIFLGGVFYAPFVLVAPALADTIIRGAALGLKLELILSLAVGGTYLAGGLALKRIDTFDPRFRYVRDALTLIGVSVSAALVAAALYVFILRHSGTIFQNEVVAVAWRAAVGDVIGGGGRYDDLMNRFGLDLPAAGFTLYIERIHKAQLERGVTEGSGS